MKRFTIEISTEGDSDIINLNPELQAKLKDVQGDGVVHLFIAGSTAALTTVEFEPGLIKHDLPRMFQKLVPDDDKYDHEATWHDDNGHSHIRASLFGPSITVPISNGKLLTGEYQQVVLIDFDTRPRRRKVICTVLI
ncbi:MAG TPA: secondary thiamine-phosphate synthase enzyme YjbQ [Tepidisphaeraceae bacterium]|nr:secondary thiamine-phosphate synthase enzyme YjbQ [Tepidisphaeraceae bacterium]